MADYPDSLSAMGTYHSGSYVPVSTEKQEFAPEQPGLRMDISHQHLLYQLLPDDPEIVVHQKSVDVWIDNYRDSSGILLFYLLCARHQAP